MLLQLALGSAVISASVVVQVVFIVLAEKWLRRREVWLARPPQLLRATLGLAAVTLWLMLAHTIGVWLWALTFLAVGVFDALEPALYFSGVAFTTLGFGDVLVGENWRLLSGLAAANGLLIFGISTAFLVEALRAIREAQGGSQ
ncbi:MAG: potassium channel family protein [Pseudomonadota bacterium]